MGSIGHTAHPRGGGSEWNNEFNDGLTDETACVRQSFQSTPSTHLTILDIRERILQ
jgi:hypothetical protein